MEDPFSVDLRDIQYSLQCFISDQKMKQDLKTIFDIWVSEYEEAKSKGFKEAYQFLEGCLERLLSYQR